MTAPPVTALNLDLHPGQRRVFHDPARFKVVVAGRRFGKSYLALVTAIVAALDDRNVQKMPVFIVAPTYPSARVIYWKRLLDMAAPLIVNSNVNLGVVELVNGVEIHIKGADRPDSLRGVGLWYAVLDEYADQKDEVWEIIVQPALSDATLYGGGQALIIGTPKGRDRFYTLAEQARVNETGEWSLHQFTSADNPFIPQKEIDSALKRMSSHAFRQEYLASFESAGGAVFQRQWFKTGTEPKEGRYYITVDLAGFADAGDALMLKSANLDEHAIAVVKVDREKWHVVEMQYGRWPVAETAKKIAQLVKKYQPAGLGVERGALMKAVEPYLREEMQKLRAMVPITALTHGNQLKTDRIVWALAGRFEHGNVTFEAGARWIEKLEDQLIQFPSKTIHDDLPDALAYIDQLVNECFFEVDDNDSGGWTPLDPLTGY